MCCSAIKISRGRSSEEGIGPSVIEKCKCKSLRKLKILTMFSFLVGNKVVISSLD